MVDTTQGQKSVADEIIKKTITGEKINKGEILQKHGYSKSTSKSPTLVTESVGFLAYMERAGLTQENLAEMLSADLSNKPGERLGEMKLASQLMGIDGAKDGGVNVQVNVALEQMKDIIDGKDINEKV